VIRRVGALILVGVATLCASPAAFAAVGGISGTVTRASDSTGVANVEVDVYSGFNLIQQACSASGGAYTVSGLAQGSYTVAFVPSSAFCGAAQNYQTQYYNGQSAFGSATAVLVNGGSTTTGVDAALQQGAIVSGTITDASTTDDVQGAVVSIFDPNNPGIDVAQSCTAANGSYTLEGIPSGTYSLEFDTTDSFCGAPQNYVTQYYNDEPTADSANSFTLTPGPTPVTFNAALVPGGTISGTVTDAASSSALPGVEVDLYSDANFQDFLRETCSAGNGSYSFSNLAPASYYVEFETGNSNCSAGASYVTQYYNGVTASSSASAVLLMPGGSRTGINAAMVGSASISGTVTDAVTHAGLQNVAVNVELGSSFVREVCTDSSGNYTAGGLAAGDYTISAQPTSGCGTVSGYDNQAYTDNPVHVETGASVINVDLALAPRHGVITGTVTNASSGDPLAGILVEARDTTGDFGSGCTAADGTYSIGSLPAGSYSVTFDPLSANCGPAQNLVPENYTGPHSSGGSVAIDGTGTVSGIDIALQAGGSASGTVTDVATRQPVADVPVEFYTPSNTAVTGGCTGADGSYTVTGLQAGTYTVVFEGSLGGCGQTHHYADLTLTGIQVQAGQTTTGVDAQLLDQSQGEISGTVTATGSGAPLAGMVVTVYDSSGAPVGSAATTNAQGAYAVTGLAAGNYRVGFSDPAGKYGADFYAGATSLSTATPIAVAGGKLSGSINAVLALKPVAVTVTAAGRLTLLSAHTLGVSAKGGLTIKLGCTGSVSCSGRATLTVKLVTRRGHKKVTKLLGIGSAAFKLLAGHTLALAIKLNRAGRAQLTKHHGRIAAQLDVTGSASGTAVRLTSSVTLKGHLKT
jgi:uncharacterized surface anchored protein